MYFLLDMVDFHCYVSLPEGNHRGSYKGEGLSSAEAGSPVFLINKCWRFNDIQGKLMYNLPEVWQFAPEKLPGPNRKGSSSNHPFSGVYVKLRGCNIYIYISTWNLFVLFFGKLEPSKRRSKNSNQKTARVSHTDRRRGMTVYLLAKCS